MSAPSPEERRCDALKTIQVQLFNTLLVVERLQAELNQFEFKEARDTSWQLKRELQWIQEQASNALKGRAT